MKPIETPETGQHDRERGGCCSGLPAARTSEPAGNNEVQTTGGAPGGCTLGDRELRERRSRWQSLDGHITRRSRTIDGFSVVYQAAPDVLRSLPGLLEAERRCCAFAQWTLIDAGSTIEVRVRGSRIDVEPLASMFAIPGAAR